MDLEVRISELTGIKLEEVTKVGVKKLFGRNSLKLTPAKARKLKALKEFNIIYNNSLHLFEKITLDSSISAGEYCKRLLKSREVAVGDNYVLITPSRNSITKHTKNLF